MQSSERSKTIALEIHTIQKEKQSKVTTKVRITSARRYRVSDAEGTREGFWDAQRVQVYFLTRVVATWALIHKYSLNSTCFPFFQITFYLTKY